MNLLVGLGIFLIPKAPVIHYDNSHRIKSAGVADKDGRMPNNSNYTDVVVLLKIQKSPDVSDIWAFSLAKNGVR